MSNKVLVVGGSYFIGRKIVDVLAKNNYEVTVLNRGTRLVDNAIQILCDRNNSLQMKDVLKNKKFDYIIDVSGTEENQMKILCNSIELSKTRKFIFISSSAVYDVDNLKTPFSENDNLALNKHWFEYGINKIYAEKYLTEYFSNKETQLIILRPPYMYGENNYAQRESFIFNRIANNLPVILPESNPKLQFLYTTDLANIITGIINKEDKSLAIYNVGNKKAVSSVEWVKICANVMNKTSEIIIYDYKKDNLFIRDFFPFPDYDNILNVESINRKLLIDETPFETGLAESYKWYLKNKLSIPFKKYVEENCKKISDLYKTS